MDLLSAITNYAAALSAELKQKGRTWYLELVVAERKTFWSKKKLRYQARFQIDDQQKRIAFFEMLKESGSGLSAGSGTDDGFSVGFGFKKEIYRSGRGGREGGIEEQSRIFGQDYAYRLDFQRIRHDLESLARKAGYDFQYQITPIGL